MKRVTPVISIVTICWIVFVINNLLLHGMLSKYGIHPRLISSLPGILWSPFLHVSFGHIVANTLPLLILGCIICARSPGEFWGVTLGGIVLGGALTWLFARNAVHIGASGLIFCYFGFLSSRAYFERTILTLLLSVICMVSYGGMLRGLLPVYSGVSWEGHLAGLLAGVVMAALVTNGRRQAKIRGTEDPTEAIKPEIAMPTLKR